MEKLTKAFYENDKFVQKMDYCNLIGF